MSEDTQVEPEANPTTVFQLHEMFEGHERDVADTAAYDMMQNGKITRELYEQFAAYMRNDLNLSYYEKLVEAERPVHPAGVDVGRFVSTYDGEHVSIGEVKADCYTQVWLEDGSKVIFHDSESESYATLNTAQMLRELSQQRVAFEAMLAEYDAAKEAREAAHAGTDGKTVEETETTTTD